MFALAAVPRSAALVAGRRPAALTATAGRFWCRRALTGGRHVAPVARRGVRVFSAQPELKVFNGHELPMSSSEVAVVDTVESARAVVETLMRADPERYHAADTEVEIDIKEVGPVGNGVVTCVTVYSGDDFCYTGARLHGDVKGAALFVDVTKPGVFEELRPWIESDTAKKVWHNYGFDRHVIENHGFECAGFAGDTFHMARLYDTNLGKMGRGYSLADLTETLIDGPKKTKMADLFPEVFKESRRRNAASKKENPDTFVSSNTGLPIKELQSNPETAEAFMVYAAYDAKSTWQLHAELLKRLQKMQWKPMSNPAEQMGSNLGVISTMSDLYERYYVPFGKLLTDMEKNGIYVDRDKHLKEIEKEASEDLLKCERDFREWCVKQLGPDGAFLNPASPKQLQVLLYGGSVNPKTGEPSPTEAEFDVDLKYLTDEEEVVEEEEPGMVTIQVFCERATANEMKALCKEKNLPVKGTKDDLQKTLIDHFDAESVEKFHAQRDGRPHVPAAPVPVLTFAKYDVGSWSKLKVAELKEACKELESPELLEARRKVETAGKTLKKAEIVALLQECYPTPQDARHVLEKAPVLLIEAATEPTDYEKWTGKKLKDHMRAHDLAFKAADKKAVLIEKIREHEGQPVLETAVAAHVEEVALDMFDEMDYDALSATCRGRFMMVEENTLCAEMRRALRQDEDYAQQLQSCAPREAELVKAPVSRKSKKRRFTVKRIGNLKPDKFTATGMPSSDTATLKAAAGDPSEMRWGTAYKAFGEGQEGADACVALSNLCQMSSIEKMLSTFIKPLRELADEHSRIHTSLNVNTDTGRLSSRKPNLQNQPALEKDHYFIRKAFQAKAGCSLVVADYGQLELRILAHIAGCTSMLDAFQAGGCFHSRTAVGMFPHVKEAVDSGEVLLEKGMTKDDDDKPLVKDVYASERRRAKTLNFSIAYGKTAFGLAKDWDVSQKEATDIVDLWYADRPEVLEWQKKVKAQAKKEGYTSTLMGRRRALSDIQSKDRKLVSKGERAAINTPIQGSAADIVTLAMLKIGQSEWLKNNGWKLLLQIHDEVILEGPDATAKEALAEVVKIMESPFDDVGLAELSVDLIVDAKCAKTWYDAK